MRGALSVMITGRGNITLASDVFKIKYIIADFKAVFFKLNLKIIFSFSNQILKI